MYFNLYIVFNCILAVSLSVCTTNRNRDGASRWCGGATLLLVSLKRKAARTILLPTCMNGLWPPKLGSSTSVVKRLSDFGGVGVPATFTWQRCLAQDILRIDTWVGIVFGPHAGHIFVGSGENGQGMAGQLHSPHR